MALKKFSHVSQLRAAATPMPSATSDSAEAFEAAATLPEASIIATGGQIFFAMDGGRAAGTAAAIRVSPATFELGKMAVSPSHQGRGLGERLGREVIEFARVEGASLVYLETNSALANAIRLYERLGFVHATRPTPSEYARADVYMEVRL